MPIRNAKIRGSSVGEMFVIVLTGDGRSEFRPNLADHANVSQIWRSHCRGHSIILWQLVRVTTAATGLLYDDVLVSGGVLASAPNPLILSQQG
jgi:hypothetical protein